MLLLRHTPANPDHQLRVLLFQLFQGAHIAEYPLFCVLTNGAGIEQNQIRLFHVIAHAKAHVHQYAADLFAVVHILLAAKAVHIRQRRCILIYRRNHGCGLCVMCVGQFFQN